MESQSEIILYQSEDGSTRIQVLLENESVWLTQAQMSELFQTAKASISTHLTNLFEEKELKEEAVVRKRRTTASDKKTYDTTFYNLDVIISVGYRVRSLRGTQFRMWATQRLKEYLIKGFTLNDERLMETGYSNPYFEELLERIRNIRTSEKNFYYKVREIYATSVDYDASSETAANFYAMVQNKFHWAIHHRTAAELIAERVNANKPNMGLTSFSGVQPHKKDVTIAKNYLYEGELKQLNLLVEQYLSFAESQAQRRKPMHMADWIQKLHEILTINDRPILMNLGKVSKSEADSIAVNEYEKFLKHQDKLSIQNLKSLEEGVEKVMVQKSAKKTKAPKKGK